MSDDVLRPNPPITEPPVVEIPLEDSEPDAYGPEDQASSPMAEGMAAIKEVVRANPWWVLGAVAACGVLVVVGPKLPVGRAAIAARKVAVSSYRVLRPALKGPLAIAWQAFREHRREVIQEYVMKAKFRKIKR